MLSTSQEGRGCPAGHRGREAQGERHDGRARVRPSASLKRLRLCALMPFGGWVVAHGVRLPGSLVMVWRSLRALMSFGVRLLMVWSCLDRDGCADLQGLKRSARVGQCASLATYTHIYNR